MSSSLRLQHHKKKRCLSGGIHEQRHSIEFNAAAGLQDDGRVYVGVTEGVIDSIRDNQTNELNTFHTVHVPPQKIGHHEARITMCSTRGDEGELESVREQAQFERTLLDGEEDKTKTKKGNAIAWMKGSGGIPYQAADCPPSISETLQVLE